MCFAIAAYAAYSKNENIRLQSSSGAIFTLFAENVIHENGAVYGVAMTDDCYEARFFRVTDIDSLAKLRGSKYLQAKLGDTYIQVKNDLEKGLSVLFSGTGCQVNGLKTFLGREYDNLFCIDVICHGTPSPALWRKYVKHMEDKNESKLIHVNFRCKDSSWNDFGMKEIDEHSNEVYISKDIDPFMQMFLRDYCLRPSCYKCIAKDKKCSDISIADFWGIESVAPEMCDGKGTSLILVRTKKGKKAFEQINDKIVMKTVSYEDAVKGNPAEYRSAKRPEQRDTFFIDMKMMDFSELKQKYVVKIQVPLKRRVKNAIKKIALQTPFRRLLGGVKCSGNYGLLFVLQTKGAG